MIDQQRDVEIAVADMADDRRDEAARRDVALASPSTHSASREIGTQTSVDNDLRAGPQAAQRPDRRRAAPATSRVRSSGLRRPFERAAAELARDLAEALRLLGDACLACRGIRGTASASRAARASNRRCRPCTCSSSSSSMRAIGNAGLDGRDRGIAGRLDRRKAADARRRSPRECRAASSVSSVMMPSVPSAPTNSRVRS